MVRIGSLCTGYGGLDMAVERLTEGRVVWVADSDRHVGKWLEEKMPGIPNLGDVREIDWSGVEPVDWVTAGYPCQPFSHAGRRRGVEDERHIWPWIAEGIGVLKPDNVLLENVIGHIRRGLHDVIADLDQLGYVGAWTSARAFDAGVPHKRSRVFILARRVETTSLRKL